MKWIPVLATCLMLATSPAFAQPGEIVISSDMASYGCNLVDWGSLVIAHVFHLHARGATSSQFTVVQTLGACMTHLGDFSSLPTVKGNSQTGIEIVYGECLSGVIYLLSIYYIGCNSPPCSYLVIAPGPFTQNVAITDCDDPPNLLSANAGCIMINSDHILCDCWDPCPKLAPIEERTWGQIKALYR